MFSSRRIFLQKLAALGGSISISHLLPANIFEPLDDARHAIGQLSPEDCAKEETFWLQVRQAFSISNAVLNLNNGGVSPQPKVVQEAQRRFEELSNQAPSYYMWRILALGKEPLRKDLARLAACSPEQIAITGNASVALEMVIFGLRLQSGDEVVLSKHDYPKVKAAWKQRQHRDGIVLRWVDFDVPSTDDEYLAQQYIRAFSSKTKVVHITHMTNWTGQILPVRKIAEVARKRGIEVLVDGAHSFAQLLFEVPELLCDYFACSLHKWLCAPFGTGMLYVRKEKIKNLYPLMACDDPESEDIRKFEHWGTRALSVEQAILPAIDFHEYIGAARKRKRLLYLKNYWTERAAHIPGLRIHTPYEESHSGAIAAFSIEGIEPLDVISSLWKEPYRIHVSNVNLENVQAVRISPNVYTLRKDLNRLLEALEKLGK